MRHALALVFACCALVVTPIALADEGSIKHKPRECKAQVENLRVPARPCRGGHWVHGSAQRSADGWRWTRNEAATLYWQLGARPAVARFLSGKVPGESGGNPKAHGPPDGKGLIQVEVQFHPELSHLALFRPIPNGVGGLHIFRKQGPGAWHAPSSAPGKIRPRLTR